MPSSWQFFFSHEHSYVMWRPVPLEDVSLTWEDIFWRGSKYNTPKYAAVAERLFWAEGSGEGTDRNVLYPLHLPNSRASVSLCMNPSPLCLVHQGGQNGISPETTRRGICITNLTEQTLSLISFPYTFPLQFTNLKALTLFFFLLFPQFISLC